MNLIAKLTLWSGAVFCTLGVSTAAYAEWPRDQPIHIVVPAPAGGTNDTATRLIGVELGKALGQGVVVENRPGASGAIGLQYVAQSRADGYTLSVASDTATILGAVRPSLPWSLDRDFTGVAMIADEPIGIAVSGKTPYKTLSQLLAAARAKPGSIAFGTSGVGTLQQIVGIWLAKLAGVRLLHVPYKGGGQAITDLVGGQIPVAVLGLAPLVAQSRNHNIRILAVTTGKRDPAVPEVPTLKELGYQDIVLSQWVGIVAPRGTPQAVVDRLSSEIAKISSRPDIRKKLFDSGLDARPMQAAEFDSFLTQTTRRWGGLVKTLGLQ